MSTMEEDDFCTELRQKTKTIHDKSDKLINLKLAVVLTDTQLWGEVLLDFYHVFLTIEQCAREHEDHSIIGTLHMPEMSRSRAFERDLQFYLGQQWPSVTKPSEAARAYCDRIVEISKKDPVLLTAYVHSMYLALLAGGQIIKRIVKKTLGLADGRGLDIFDFDGDSRSELRKSLINRINCLELTREQKDNIVSEKICCFQMNNALAENVKLRAGSFKRILKFLILIILIVMVFIYLMYLIFN